MEPTSPLGRTLPPTGLRLLSPLLLLLLAVCGLASASSNPVIVAEKVDVVLGKDITLSCRRDLASDHTISQISWERPHPSGPITVAVFNPDYGIAFADEYAGRVTFVSPSTHDATIIIKDVGLADGGTYTCKMATYPLGIQQATTVLYVLVEPKIYVSPGPAALLDGGNETLVATCTAEHGRPAPKVFWETELHGRYEKQREHNTNDSYTVHVRYLWLPERDAVGKKLVCVVIHPTLQKELRIPFALNVQFAPIVSITGLDGNWYVGQENVKFTCGAKANPPARQFTWIRLDGTMPEGVEISNSTLAFARRLEITDSGVYRCEVRNDVGVSSQNVNLWVYDPPPTTAAPTTTASLPIGTSGTGNGTDEQQTILTSPTLATVNDSSIGAIVGGAVGGVVCLIFLMIIGGVCFMRQRRTFRGDYYAKQYLGPSDMQKESQLDVLQPHELQEVYGDKMSKGSQELKPKLGGDIIYPDYTPERKDGDDWTDKGDVHRGLKEGNIYPDMHPCGPPVHSPVVNNGSPYLPEYCYDNGTEGDYVSHMDGSVISRREWYV